MAALATPDLARLLSDRLLLSTEALAVSQRLGLAFCWWPRLPGADRDREPQTLRPACLRTEMSREGPPGGRFAR